jgi:hypothetical protein
MAEKSLVNESTETVPDPELDPDVVVVEEDELLLPHAPATSPPTSNIVTSARLLPTLMMVPPVGCSVDSAGGAQFSLHFRRYIIVKF